MIISNLVQCRKYKLQLRFSCTRGAQGSTVLAPPTSPPPAPWPSHILPPSPLLTAPPCHLVLFTQSHTHIHTQSGIFFPISFQSEKQDEGPLSDSRLPWKPPYSSSVKLAYNVTHTHTHSCIKSDRMLDI